MNLTIDKPYPMTQQATIATDHLLKDIAVVILNWNGSSMLAEYLPSVVEHSAAAARIIVADNGSTDDSLAMLREHFPMVELIELDRNYGFAEGYNRALAQVEAAYYVLLNSDVEVTPHWLQPLREYMDAHPDTAACQPKLLSAINHSMFEYAGAAGGMLDRYGYAYCRGRVFDVVESDKGQYEQPISVDWATGACLFIRASDYRVSGGLDARFFAHFEEIDLCWRLRLRGRTIACVPQSTVYHLGGGTLPQGNPQKTYLNFRNNLTMLHKCLLPAQCRRVMRMRWLLDNVAAWKALILDRNIKEFKAIRKARKDFKQWREDFPNEALLLAEQGFTPTPSSAPDIVVLWQYYFRHKRLFSQFPQ